MKRRKFSASHQKVNKKCFSNSNNDLLPASNDHYKNTDFGQLVWGKVPGSRIWPGIIIHYSDCGMVAPNDRYSWIFWFGDNRVSLAQLSKVYNFVKNFLKYYSSSCTSLTYQRGVHEILKICHKRAEIAIDVCTLEFASLISWARGGFINSLNSDESLWITKDLSIPEKFKKIIDLIKQAQDLDFSPSNLIDEFPTATSSSESDSDSEERRAWRSKAVLLKEVRAGTTFLDSICIACEKGQESPVISLHPVFEGGLCEPCKATSDSLVQSSEDLDVLCTICCSPGEVVVCDNELCDRVFCLGCIELLISPSAIQRIKKKDPWFCFLCLPYEESTHGLIIPRPEYQQKHLAEKNTTEQVFNELPEDAFIFNPESEKRPIRILSLFDGISTGLHVMDKLNIKVEVYVASEVEENAINVSKMQFGSRIMHIGDIQKWSDTKVKELCPIDLLIGGSPCNDLSFVNPQRKGLFDPNGTGILFFHFFRILKTIQCFNGERHLFWLFENVAAMPKEYKRHINLFLQRSPVVIDARFFSPQKRARNFWGNIPAMYEPLPENIISQKHTLSSTILSDCNRIANVDKINCVTTNSNSLRINGGMDYPVIMNGIPDIPWITEIEQIFGFPAHYTDVGNLGVRERQALLGRAWSVPVICHILSPLCKFFLQIGETSEDDVSEESFHGWE